ncbi:MAG: cupin domain-containing protein [Lentisphaeraceae bacterium]|nr:cupin domain-containing protein [Lentisphaeraceae bacterium]
MSFNLFDNIPSDLPEEIFEDIFKSDDLKIERIVSKGHVSPEGFWYDQDKNEWVVLLEGEAEVELEGKKVLLHKGDSLFIAKHRKHRVSYTSCEPRCIWLAIHFK